MHVFENKVTRFTHNNEHLLVSDIQQGKHKNTNNAQAEVDFYLP